MKVLLIVGMLWPFVLAAGLLAAQMAGVELSDGVDCRATSANALGIPAVGIALSSVATAGVAGRVAGRGGRAAHLPLFAAELFLALLLLAVGMYSLGFAPA